MALLQCYSSLFSAIFANFLGRMGDFLENLCYDDLSFTYMDIIWFVIGNFLRRKYFLNRSQIFGGLPRLVRRRAHLARKAADVRAAVVHEARLPRLLQVGRRVVPLPHLRLATLQQRLRQNSRQACRRMQHLRRKKIQVIICKLALF
jgi:hypothetical protein